MRSSSSVVALLAALLFLPAMQPQDATDNTDLSALTAAQLLERMTKVYASCKSYRESGDLHLELNNHSGDPALEPNHFDIGQDKHVEIAFVRPDRFRFESTDTLTHCIAWRQGAEVRSWCSLYGKVDTKPSLKEPLDGFAGISGGTSLLIPGLLLPDEVGSPLSRLVDVERRRDGSIEGNPCFQISGKVEKGSPGKVKTLLMTVWIDQHTFLVRRAFFKAGSQTATFTMTIDGKVDVDVSNADLAFKPTPPK